MYLAQQHTTGVGKDVRCQEQIENYPTRLTKPRKKTAQKVRKDYFAFFSFRKNYSVNRTHRRPGISKEQNRTRNGQMRQTTTQYNNKVGVINKVDVKITYFTKKTASITILRYEKFQSSVKIIIHFVYLFN